MKLVQILEEKSIRLERGWFSDYKIDGAEVKREVYEKEQKRACLWENKTSDYKESPGTRPLEPIINISEITTQYLPLPWYNK